MVRLVTGAKGRCLLMGGLSAAILFAASPVMAGNPTWGGGKNSDSQVVKQANAVSGTVVDENGEPLIGVSVLVKGSSQGTVTDFDGKFSLNVAADAILQISYIGYQTQEVKVGKQKLLKVTLKPNA